MCFMSQPTMRMFAAAQGKAREQEDENIPEAEIIVEKTEGEKARAKFTGEVDFEDWLSQGRQTEKKVDYRH